MIIEGPYSFKDVDGFVAPAYIFLPGGEKREVGKVAVKVDGGMTFEVSLTEEHKDLETATFEVPMRFTYLNREEPKIIWGFNCLTPGVHHGRPEKLWNLPLIQAAAMFQVEDLREIVITRIYQDAMQFVEHGGDVPRLPETWARVVAELAEEKFETVLNRKLEDIQKYYHSSFRQRDVDGVIDRLKANKLNRNYEPLHDHDTINLLCRILGESAKHEASGMPGVLPKKEA